MRSPQRSRRYRASGARPAVKLAFEFLVLTASRSGEIQFAAWDEIDTVARVWAIPATRMMKRDHRMPCADERCRSSMRRGRLASDRLGENPWR